MSTGNEDIDVTGLPLPRLFAALYDAARPLGLGRLHYTPAAMTEAEAAALIAEHTHNYAGEVLVSFDYVRGRPLKFAFVTRGERTWLVRPGLYDRDQGAGLCARVVASVRAESGR